MLFQHPTPHPSWLWSGTLPLFPTATSRTTSYDGSSNLRTVTFTDTITAPKVGTRNVVVLRRLWLLPASALYLLELKPLPWFTTLLWIIASRREWIVAVLVVWRGKKQVTSVLPFKIKSQFEDTLMGPLTQKKLLNPPSQRAVGEKRDLVVLVPRQRQKSKLRRRRQSTAKSSRTSFTTPSLSPGNGFWTLSLCKGVNNSIV